MAAQYVKLKVPEFNAIGQGERPEHLTIKVKGKIYQLKFGEVFKVSTKCDPENQIANLDAQPYKLIHQNFVNQLNNQFEIIKQGEK